MEEAMGADLDSIKEKYGDVSRTKLELTAIFYDLRNALDKLLQARNETLIRRLKYVRRRTARKQILWTVGKAARLASVSAAIPVSIVALPAGIACAGTALGLAAAVPTGEAVESRRRQKILTKASGDDIVLCNEAVAAPRNLAEHLDAIEPLHVLEPPLGDESCARKLVQSVLDLMPVVSFFSTSTDMKTSFVEASADQKLVELALNQLEIENDRFTSLLEVMNQSFDFAKGGACEPSLI